MKYLLSFSSSIFLYFCGLLNNEYQPMNRTDMDSIINVGNPFFEEYHTPHGTVPFDRIRTEHYEPAILKGIELQKAEIEAITESEEEPTFANTVEAYERSGSLLDRVTTVFSNMLSWHKK